MKYKKYFYCYIFASICFLAGCSNMSEIERTTQKYLEGFYSHDFESLYDISTEKTLDVIKDMESRARALGEIEQVAPPIIVIHEYYLEGDTAYCRYTLMQDKEDSNAISENLMLINKDDKWLVEYKFY